MQLFIDLDNIDLKYLDLIMTFFLVLFGIIGQLSIMLIKLPTTQVKSYDMDNNKFAKENILSPEMFHNPPFSFSFECLFCCFCSLILFHFVCNDQSFFFYCGLYLKGDFVQSLFKRRFSLKTCFLFQFAALSDLKQEALKLF